MSDIEYFMSIMSPWSYLGSARFSELAAKSGRNVVIHPMNVGEVFANSGGLPLPKRHPKRQAYRLVELARWKDELGMDKMVIEPDNFPANDANGGKMIAAAKLRGDDAVALAHHYMAGLWERDLPTQSEKSPLQ